MKLLLDTTVLIDVLRNRKGRRELLADWFAPAIRFRRPF
jgi:predicted nucleic acid-binding protein